MGLRRFRRYAAPMMRLTVLGIDAPLFFISFWLLDLDRVFRFLPIPIIATALVLLPLWFSPRIAEKLIAEKKGQGSFILSAAFSNIGTTGGAFICYLLFGLEGLALGYLFLLPYPVLIFTLGFSVAKHHTCDCRLSWRDYLGNILGNLIAIVPLLAIALGLVLNTLGLRPPTDIDGIIDLFVKAGLGIMCLAIGMTLNLKRIFTPAKAIWSLAGIKFIALPAIAIMAALLAYGSLTTLPAKIIVIQSAMPPAIYAVITANIFNLDRDLVNALWFSTTLMLIPVAAGLFFIFH